MASEKFKVRGEGKRVGEDSERETYSPLNFTPPALGVPSNARFLAEASGMGEPLIPTYRGYNRNVHLGVLSFFLSYFLSFFLSFPSHQ